MLKVMQILPALDVGGVERGTLEVASALVNAGHQSIVVSAGGRLVKQLQSQGSRHINLKVGEKSLLTLLLIKKLRSIIIENNIDILHVRSRMPAWIAWLAWKGLDKDNRPGLITTVHGPYSVSRYSAIMVRGEYIIAISDFIRDYILSNYPWVDKNKVRTIYRGVDPAIYYHGYTPTNSWLEGWRHAHPQTRDTFILTLPARITRWKGHEDFISIMDELLKTGLPVHGIVAGGHDHKDRFYLSLKKRLSDTGLDKYISFIGHRADMKEVMAISNIVLSLAKIPEAFGRTALEALALGVPVIAYDHGGASEVLNALFPEGLVEPGNTNAVVEKAVQFYQSKPEPDNHNPFTLEQMLTKTLCLYEEVAEHNQR